MSIWVAGITAAGALISTYSASQDAKKARKDAAKNADKGYAAQKEESRMDTARAVWMNQQAKNWSMEDRRRVQDVVNSYGTEESRAPDSSLIDPAKGLLDFNPGDEKALDKLDHYFHPEDAVAPAPPAVAPLDPLDPNDPRNRKATLNQNIVY